MPELNTIAIETGLKSPVNMRHKPPVFILGSGRSGTSLLRSILENHPDIYCIPGETHIFSPDSNPYLEELKSFEASNDVKNLTLTMISSILFGHECTALFAMEKKFPREVIQIYNEINGLFATCDIHDKHKIFTDCVQYISAKENKKIWVEKTPNHIFNLPEILSVYPNAKFIEIYRDPRAVYYSWQNAKQEYFKKSNIIECITKWNKTYEYSKKYASELPNQFYKLKYENLLENPKAELVNLCQFLNEEFNPSLLDVAINTEKADEWKNYLSKYELLFIDLKTKKYRDELDYTDSEAKLNLINILPLCLFYINQWLIGRTIFLINRLIGRTIILINKYIETTDQLLQSIYKKPYSTKRRFKTLLWVLKRKKVIKNYLKNNTIKKLNIGAGPNMLSGWLNTNIMSITKEDIFLDASIRFPFKDDTFDYIFSEHQIEHLTYTQGLVMLKECFRILKPAGKIRITTPNLESFINLYKNPKEIEKVYIDYTVKRLFPELEQNKEIFVLNKLFSYFGHRFIYDKNSLELNLKNKGFADIKFYTVGVTGDNIFKNIEQHPKMFEKFGFKNGEELSKFDSIACEAIKP